MIAKLRYLVVLMIATMCVTVMVMYHRAAWKIRWSRWRTIDSISYNEVVTTNITSRERDIYRNRKFLDQCVNGTVELPQRNESWGIADTLQQYLNVSAVCDTLAVNRPYNFTIVPWNVGPEKMRSAKLRHNDSRIIHSLVVFIKSRPENFLQRKIARWTWAGFEFVDGLRVEVVFMIGRVNDDLKERILHESEKYGDVLQIESDESYKNVIHKTVAGMQYASKNFPPTWFYASADDDMMPDILLLKDNLWRMINDTKGKVTTKKNSNCMFEDCYPIFCGFRYNKNSLPRRNHTSKWFVSEETYPNERFPSYCNGGWYTMSVKLAGELYLLSRTSNYFWIDDVWVTGLLRLKYFSRRVSCVLNDIDVGLWTYNSRYLAFSKTGGEDDLMTQWAKYAAKIYKKSYVHVGR